MAGVELDANLYRFGLDAGTFAILVRDLARLAGGSVFGALQAGVVVVLAAVPAIALGGGFG